MPKASPLISAFNAGEWSSLLDGRSDVGKYNSACLSLQNFIPTVQGPAVRRSGTRFVAELKSSASRAWLVRFEFNVTQAYILEFGNLYIRFYTNHGQVVSGATPYEIVSPYAVADLTNADGSCALKFVQSGDVVYLVHRSYPVQKLVRTGATSWAISAVSFTGGPFGAQNIDETSTVYASAATGAGITITASNDIFETGHIGAQFLIEQPDASAVLPWEAYSKIAVNDLRVSDGKIYKCIAVGAKNAWSATVAYFANDYVTSGGKEYRCIRANTNKTPASFSSTAADWDQTAAYNVGDLVSWNDTVYEAATSVTAGRSISDSTYWRVKVVLYWVEAEYPTVTGVAMPTHSTGSAWDGSGADTLGDGRGTIGVEWQYQNAGYGVVQITARTSAKIVTATVLSTLPDSVVGSGNTTFRWAHARYSAEYGYPDVVAFFRDRLVLGRDQYMDLSVAGDFEDFSDRDDGGRVVADQAISITIQSDQINSVRWAIPASTMLVGTAGGEFSIGEISTGEALGPSNIRVQSESAHGSRQVQAIRANDSILFFQRAGRKVRELQFDFSTDGYKASDLTVFAEHIAEGGLIDMAWASETDSVLWCARNDGALVGFTFNREQDVLAWHRHPVGGSGIVECVEVIPAPDGTHDELWMIVRRTIDGATKRYIEYMEANFDLGDDLADAFFVDSGLTYSGAAATTISGLDHLEGCAVDILADGATHPQRTVSSGEITLQRSATKVQVGLPCPCVIEPMQLDAGAADGTAQGKTKRITRIAARFRNTLGGKIGPDASNLDAILFRSGSDPMDSAPELFTGDKQIDWPAGYEEQSRIYYTNDQPLPVTVVAFMPQIVTQDR